MKTKILILLIGIINFIYPLNKIIETTTHDEWGVYFNKDYFVWCFSGLLLSIVGILFIIEEYKKNKQ